MRTVSDVLHFINTLAPTYMKMDWDNVGLNCGRLDRPVTKILVALDPFEEAIHEAIEFGAELLVTHHVLIHEPGFITDSDRQGQRVLTLIENGIAHINAHTNLDCAPGGVNDCLAATLGLENVEVLNPMSTDAAGTPYGLLRMGTVQEQALNTFLTSVKEKLCCKGLRYISSGNPVHRVAVGGGACGDGLYDVHKAGCDTFVTSDIKYNIFRDAYDLGINLIDAGHFYTENPVCRYLAEQLETAFPGIQIKLSESHKDHTNFFV